MLLEGVAGPVSEEQAALLRRVISSSENLIEVVGAVLEIARLKSGGSASRLKACSPCKVVDGAVSTITPLARQKGLVVNVTSAMGAHTGMYHQAEALCHHYQPAH